MHISTYIKQKSYEKIEYQIRRHLVTTVPASIGFLLLLIAPFGTYFLVKHSFADLLFDTSSLVPIVLFVSIYYLSIALFSYTYFVNYYIDLLLITNDRLLHIEQQGIFSRTISEVDLYKIQDITSEITGFFPSLFNYGDLLIQTAGALEKFMIFRVPNPEGLRQTILDLAEADRKFHESASTQPTL
jgi:membrane protein YdbS with pleckstrin-like domain